MQFCVFTNQNTDSFCSVQKEDLESAAGTKPPRSPQRLGGTQRGAEIEIVHTDSCCSSCACMFTIMKLMGVNNNATSAQMSSDTLTRLICEADAGVSDSRPSLFTPGRTFFNIDLGQTMGFFQGLQL
ncbi:hypothetical protein MHYP_G00136770 [Metynnis hypsauchen]